MMMSDNTAELFSALSKFQGELDNASKNKKGHGYKYADLAEVINVAKDHLANNGLAVVQLLGSNEIGKQTLITMLTHSSGQYMRSEVVMVDAVLSGAGGKNPVQLLGSAITYHRRYAYAAIVGLAQEDDDAAGMRQPKININDVHKGFISMSHGLGEEQLKREFGKAYKALSGHPELQAEVKKFYDIRKHKLETGNDDLQVG